MAEKNTTIFSCTNCDAQFTKWNGRCLECGKWGTLEKAITQENNKSKNLQDLPVAKTTSLKDIAGKNIVRAQTHISELDRVLGGGIVPGSLTLLGGEPGIGKSTLSLQLAASIPNTLYFSGEESVEQIKLRADRLNMNDVKTHSHASLSLSNETNIDVISSTIKKLKPQLVIVDSMQTMWNADATGESGSVSQIRACTVTLLDAAKSSGVPVVLIGHVTKDGTVAGPKTLEHLVDTVLYLEGDRYHVYRILRAVKNRFGSTDEVGIFEMKSDGLFGVANPSAAFLAERGDDMPGSIITCLMEGTRPLLVEIQALVNKTSFGYPVRKASGFDINRLHVLVAVLQKRAGLDLGQYDIHLNVVGGVKATEPSVDLAVCLAIASSFKEKSGGKDLVVFGEVGLGGEVRSVRFLEKRIKEAAQLGMTRVITAASKAVPIIDGVKTVQVKNIEELIAKT
ncbi:MAG: repair protein radA protein [Candidatus Magasanikbacteria bacterium GW2011_GWD2_43_18]|uniref:DNA repair protein RadA n=1 Tax=Candidatus Magasanikbacteria bacterium GW2011_GWE2_42_7 TaxID=1619052 RepID=A0A0G1BDC2_9BACT|nr:MAG: repair protein radA protein [Candidatus Magasanikbacteria bacterium GW2011_GWC2_42_27]KKS71297.1 MAG: repair protein radA protein [Candidatus Magasanikbacteria bacterium GW2011_GWE2_42_7]KKT03767.1 MAG: repair protein radA protein [Candidatus Magasanikbacteria bacterium GW2011_GWD2_43_18]KKT25473.1 MAG: repair protein radA protein [Candidatus Magasanikbacteria bacterium GW2011_GWA2_43_9]HBB38416.1 DNA repair protein RadA [Candidatus Magasanikbacteria bacterium]